MKDYESLHPSIQKWIYKQGWSDLRDIQKDSIQPILSETCDLVISASTASGKTEAAFLPACSNIMNLDQGFGILYISPLKALINDQYRRLKSISDITGLQVVAWHGDSSSSEKKKAKQDPKGIVLITPESLESLLVRDSALVFDAMRNLKYIIIDEYHAFIGRNRGYHLLSLLNRLEVLLKRTSKPIPRIALSATLGNMDEVIESLRPNKMLPCKIITQSGKTSNKPLKVIIKGYENEPVEQKSNDIESLSKSETANELLLSDLYNSLRGDSHLVFANSRARTEYLAAELSSLCNENHVPNEFFPHHGSLSKDIRHTLETRLQQGKYPTTAVCTMTLELGIDIGKVSSVVQVTAPHSVSSLRQRLGRSGRRGESPTLKVYITEEMIVPESGIVDRLRMELLQSIAMLRLLIQDRWYEPADLSLSHFSTLLHQILAIVGQWGGVRVDQLWNLLCKSGVFNNIILDDFKQLLTSMGSGKLISQMSNGEIILGVNGEKIVEHYTFYSVFFTPEEYRVQYNDKSLGTLPSTTLIIPDQHIIFAGRHWIVNGVDPEKKVVSVIPTKGGNPPNFGGSGLSINDRVRQEMLEVYLKGDYRISVGSKNIDYLDSKATKLFEEGLDNFRLLFSSNHYIIIQGTSVFIAPWMGDKIVNTIAVLCIIAKFKVSSYAGVIEVEGTTKDVMCQFLADILKMERPSNEDLAYHVENKFLDKYDYLLPENLLNKSYGSAAFDVEGTCHWIENVLNNTF